MNLKFPVDLTIHKEGKMIYFSQLDLFLVLKRALRRTNLPNYFTQGFRPDIKISFQGALRLGDKGAIPATFYFRKKISPQKVSKALARQLPKGLKATV